MNTKTLVVLGLLTVCTLTVLPTAAADHFVIIADTDGDGDCEATVLPAPERGHGILYVPPCSPGGG